MASIYEQHDATFRNVSAFVITNSVGVRIATVAFKRGNAVTCYAHIIGIEMTKGIANGGGYDRNSASFYNACEKMVNCNDKTHGLREWQSLDQLIIIFKDAAKKGNGGSHWHDALRAAGFNVFQAV